MENTYHEVGRGLEGVVLAELLQREVEDGPLHLRVQTHFEGALQAAHVLLGLALRRQTQQLRGV